MLLPLHAPSAVKIPHSTSKVLSFLAVEQELGNVLTPAFILRRNEHLFFLLLVSVLVLIVYWAEPVVGVLEFMSSLLLLCFNLPHTFLFER